MRRFALVLLGMLALAGCAESAPCDEPHTCPADGPINCMPSVPRERVPLCSGECHQWIVDHCPGVTFSF